MRIDIHQKLCHVRPSELEDGSGGGMPLLLINIITRACYDKSFKKLAGWRGMAPTQSHRDSWTFKLKGYPGIFGLGCEGTEGDGTRQATRFLICHFPDTRDEALVNRLNLHAATTAHRPDYLERVRDFSSHPEMAEPFCVGHLSFVLDLSSQQLSLSLEALSEKRVIASDGIPHPEGKQHGFLVPPGACEEESPAFALASPLFEAICAAVTRTLEAPPCFFRETRSPGEALSYNAKGEVSTQAAPDITRIRQSVAYGQAPEAAEAAPSSREETTWREGEALPSTLPALIWQAATPDTALAGISAPLPDKRPQLIVLTGFLGSGKTTFINNFVEYHNSRNTFVAVVQNEIGETGLDGRLLEANCNVVEIDEGCVCCTLAGKLSAGITDLLSRFTPEVVILETTGLANAFNLLDEIEELRELVRFDSVTTVVDCANAPTAMRDYEVAREQVRAADIVILNKTDLAGPTQTRDLKDAVQKLNPGALLLETTHGNINPGLLYDDAVTDHAAPASRSTAHAHHACHGDEGIGALKISLERPLRRDDFLAALGTLPPEILRVKGIVRFDDAPESEVCQYVGGRLDLSRHTGPTDEACFLIVIGRDIHNQPLPGVLYAASHSTGRPPDDPHRLLFAGCACGHH